MCMNDSEYISSWGPAVTAKTILRSWLLTEVLVCTGFYLNFEASEYFEHFWFINFCNLS